ncbi:MAG: UDP-N-acetylenolpyruvoylglucosamine reductase [Candidatus Omnitrophica bacterium CG11_big_fil_rev_8_21_14_0_20_45_26]|uniref:UDP-N-acetylenolpyruvoylglucosamine reductase n=1 Tax=Candidatus Abzuiibacterium crystallinum TaxID=1974748 RepID=A0A2H0LPL1_9BACT|nr:MAG: UDP-N-acetylenolpyruvoylglucosamine reductase [Candidatus Omnitrophica bacterium CG11_big_fil_rev_8_21_14_0_20_45_26]PIW64311.1 MAG: UDP-N-acetylenolpyruvoylglucosamine reductase [Candidatus Omnitrophica bacterium CG12_big_fil_rev_8_21_14_0_65_45_16]
MNLPIELQTLIQSNVPLCRFSNFQIGGQAELFAQPQTREELKYLLQFRQDFRLPLIVIGRASNLLFSDEGFEGLVISLMKFEKDRVSFRETDSVKASAGTGLFKLSQLCQEKGLGGLEFLCHIPGTVGGAVRMNAGFNRPGKAYREVKDVLITATAIDLNGSEKALALDDIDFRYRESNLDDRIVLDATFKLKPSTPGQVREEIRANFAYRNSVQDLQYPSVGSIFKNPKKQTNLTSGQLIEKVGLKGFQVGGAMFSLKHGNFILNIGHAKAQDVLELIAVAQTKVREAFGVELETEVKVIPARPTNEALEVGMIA